MNKFISSNKKVKHLESFIMQQLHAEGQQAKKQENRPAVIICVISRTYIRQVANELWKKTDEQLLVSGRTYVEKIGLASSIFVTPFTPSLADCTTALDQFETSMIAAAGGGVSSTSTKDTKRVAVMNILTRLGSSYIEGVANNPANATTGAEVIIETAGMRVKPLSRRNSQQWAVYAGPVNGSLKLTAPSMKTGAHQWAYTTTPSDDSSWTDWNPDNCTIGRTIITGLVRGSLVYCCHRTLTEAGVSDWEGHDPVIVP